MAWLFTPSPVAIEYPSCPKCNEARMALARVAPGPKGFDIRTFECGKCDYAHVIEVAIEPMKPTKAERPDGEPKSPQ